MGMDVTTLQQMIHAGETYTVEFKKARRRNDLSDDDIVEAAMCLANGQGGTLLLGVEDSGEVTGTAPRHGRLTDPSLIAAMILNRTDPPVPVRAQVIDLSGHDVVVIEIEKSATPVGTRSGVYKRRSIRLDGKPECIPYRPQEMLSAGLALAGRDYAEAVLPEATMDDLDPAEFGRFRSGAAGGGDTVLANAADLDILRALRLVSPQGGVTVGAILLFGRVEALCRWAPTAECLFQVTTQVGGLGVNESLRLPLLAAADALYERLSARNSEQEVVVGLHRISLPVFPGRIAREAVANALVHRDYTELGSVQVQLSESDLRVSSPGGFPPGVTLANMLTESRPRSPILADAFKRAGMVDRAGRGIPEMFMAVLRTGRAEPDYSLSTDHSVTVVIPTAGTDLDFVRAILHFENDRTAAFTLDQLRVLSHLKLVGPSSIQDLANELRMIASTLRITLNRLVEFGLVETRGTGRARRYHLSAGFYRSAEDRGAYVRVAGTDRPSQQQMILDYVRTYGRITRAQVANLCLTSSQDAASLLRELRALGRLELRGEKRGAYYILPTDSGALSG